MNFNELLKEIRNKPEKTKIKILWSIIILLGIIFFIWWINIAKHSINNISENIKNLEIDKNLVITEEIEKEIERVKSFITEEELKIILEDITNEEEFRKAIEEIEKEKNQNIILEEEKIESEE